MFELRRLRYLVTLAMRLSFTRAAEDLGITQSTLTRAIQSLEEEMGLRLFDRDQAGVTLTSDGQRVVEKAEGLLAHAKDFDHQVRVTSRRLEGRIRFGMTSVVMQALLPATIPARLHTAPRFVHECLVGEPESLWRMLTAREIEFFVCPERAVPDALPVRIDMLGTFPMTLAVRPDHPLLNGTGAPEGYPVLVSAYGLSPGDVPVPTAYALEGGLHLFDDFTILSKLAQETDAIWMTSAPAIAQELASGLLADLAWPDGQAPGNFKVAMYSLQRRSLSPSAQEIRRAFQEHVRGFTR